MQCFYSHISHNIGWLSYQGLRRIQMQCFYSHISHTIGRLSYQGIRRIQMQCFYSHIPTLSGNYHIRGSVQYRCNTFINTVHTLSGDYPIRGSVEYRCNAFIHTFHTLSGEYPIRGSVEYRYYRCNAFITFSPLLRTGCRDGNKCMLLFFQKLTVFHFSISLLTFTYINYLTLFGELIGDFWCFLMHNLLLCIKKLHFKSGLDCFQLIVKWRLRGRWNIVVSYEQKPNEK